MKQLSVFLIALLITANTYAQNARAQLLFEEAETIYNELRTTNKRIDKIEQINQKLDEVEKIVGEKPKTLYLRALTNYSCFEYLKEQALYISEKAERYFMALEVARKSSKRYLELKQNDEVDDRYREIYKINNDLQKYPKDKATWLKEKQRLEAELAEKTKQAEELDKHYREITLKIDAWEWNDKIRIGENYKTLKKQYPEVYKTFNDKPKATDNVQGNTVIWGSKNILNPKDLEVKVIKTEFDIITRYYVELSEVSAKDYLAKWKAEFGEDAISEYLSVVTDSKVGLYVLQSPYTKVKIYIQYVSLKGYSKIFYTGAKEITNLSDGDFFKQYEKIK